MKEHVLFASSICGGCKSAIALVKQPKYEPHVRIAFVNESQEAYDEMATAGIYNTPTLLTQDGQKIGGAANMSTFLEGLYG